MLRGQEVVLPNGFSGLAVSICSKESETREGRNVEALIIRIGFWGLRIIVRV